MSADITSLLQDAGAALCGLVLALLVVRTFKFGQRLATLLALLQKSMAVMLSPRISEHWKERVLPRYSWLLLRGALVLTLLLAGLLCLFALGFVTALLVSGIALDAAFARMSSLQAQLVTLVLGLAAWWLLGRKQEPEIGGSLERLLHELALGLAVVPRLALAIDLRVARSKRHDVVRPVYVSGLARSGTTLVLESLYRTDAFTSLTYRNMPFVTAPWLWSRVTRHRRALPAQERAHGDGVLVNDDSPESFEEVFWQVRGGRQWIKQHGLLPHEPDAAVLADYARYVGNILAAGGSAGARRYLCKDSNHLLRLDAVFRCFPDAIVIVPFRHPLAHARSLANQHRRFVERQTTDPYALRYMNWLAHHEFGLGLRPFLLEAGGDGEQATATASGYPGLRAGAGQSGSTPGSSNDINWWLCYWQRVYTFVLDHHADRVHLLDYDRLLADPASSLAALAALVDVEPAAMLDQAERVSHASETEPVPAEQRAVYDRLCAQRFN